MMSARLLSREGEMGPGRCASEMVTPVGIARGPVFLTAWTCTEGCLDGLTTGQLLSPERVGQDRGREGDSHTPIYDLVLRWEY